MKTLSRVSFYLISVLLVIACTTSRDWRTASRDSANIAPDPLKYQKAVVQVYGADAWGWRGWFAIHTWIAVKKSGKQQYTVHDVVGWRGYRGSPVLSSSPDIPDRHWFGAKPQLLVEHRGEGVDSLINDIENAVASYPWKNEYTAFPGPNSNTFVAWVGKQVPELNLKLPFSAIGSGYINQIGDNL